MLVLIACLVLALFLLYVAYTVCCPTIISHPYATSTSQTSDTPDTQALSIAASYNSCCLAGSYNPPHLGHLAMLTHLSKIHKTVYAIVGFNPSKHYPVSPQARLELLQKLIANAELKNVKAVLVSGLIWRYCAAQKISTMYRGIRSWKEDGTAESVLNFQNTFFPPLLGPFTIPIPTVFLSGNPTFNHISSTLVRNLCESPTKANKKQLSDLVTEPLVAQVIDKYANSE